MSMTVTNYEMPLSALYRKERMEALTGGAVSDAYVSVDLTPNGTDSPVLWIDNAGESIGSEDGEFRDTTSSGSTHDYFRLSAIGTGYSSAIGSNSSSALDVRQATPLGRLWFLREGAVRKRTGMYTFRSEASIMRLQRFVDLPDGSPGTYEVALEVKLPGEQPRPFAPAFPRRQIDITSYGGGGGDDVVACMSVESSDTWRLTPQRLDAGCTAFQGVGAQYSWRWTNDETGTSWSPWTAYRTDPALDFAGHWFAGSQKVQMEVVRTDGAADTTSRTFSVVDDAVSVSGPTSITYKSTYTYNSNIVGYWFEQYPPDPAWTQKVTSASSSLGRVWPAEEYEVVLRQEGGGSPLRRDHLEITVCTVSGDCSGGVAQSMDLQNTAPPAGLDMGIFGAGPVLSVRPGEAISFYSLAGVHDAATPFSGSEWQGGGSGVLGESGSAADLQWEADRLGQSAIRLRFSDSTGVAQGSFFGFAWDPDVGSHAHDDRSGYDERSGLLYVFDEEQAAGLLLRRNGAHAVSSAWQYGSRRFAPTAPSEVARVLRSSGFDLLRETDDVQVLVSTGEIGAGDEIEVYLLEAATVDGLHAAAAELGIGGVAP